MTFHLNIKFRAFGITFGAIDEKIDGTTTLTAVVNALLPAITKLVPAAALLSPSTLISQISVAPHVIYNSHGVLLETVTS